MAVDAARGTAMARLLLRAGAVQVSRDRPFVLAAGWASPIYVDCRRLIGQMPVRRAATELMLAELAQRFGSPVPFDAVAGGETAGIPWAAWLADRLDLRLCYVRKRPLGIGRHAQVEGGAVEGLRTLLVDDLATDAGSKAAFVRGLRMAGATVTDALVIFYHGVFPGGAERLAALALRCTPSPTGTTFCAWMRSSGMSRSRRPGGNRALSARSRRLVGRAGRAIGDLSRSKPSGAGLSNAGRRALASGQHLRRHPFMDDIVIVAAARTPVGSFSGALGTTEAHALGTVALQAAMQRAGVEPGEVDEVILGQVLAAGEGQNPARQAARGAGLPDAKTAFGINQVCGSGLRAVALAAQQVRTGESAVVAAGGMESMSMSRHAAFLRSGTKMGGVEFIDTMLKDGLWDAFHGYHMGSTAENVARAYQITREEQDQFALASQTKASAAQKGGRFKDEIAPVTVKGRKGDTVVGRR